MRNPFRHPDNPGILSVERTHTALPGIESSMYPAVPHSERRTSCRYRSVALGCLILAACAAPESDVTELALEEVVVATAHGARFPSLERHGEAVVLSWLEPHTVEGEEVWALKGAPYEDGILGKPYEVTRSGGGATFFVNWADFPVVWPVGDGRLAAHWLQRGGPATYDYGVRVSFSEDGGHSWSAPWTPHEDGTPSEHGFVSVFGLGHGEAGMVWLDGRRFFGADGSRAANPRMTLRYRTAGADGTTTAEVELDDRICDCCQTDAAMTSEGPVVVYRDRTEEEVRDISVGRFVDGKWTGGVPVHDDGWVIPGCPVNGPSVAAAGDEVVVAWFTGAGNTPRVRAAFSSDAGATFGPPVTIDLGNPVGRVATVMPEPGTALVAWLEDERLFARIITADGNLGRARLVAASSNARASGFPAMLVDSADRVVFAQTAVDEGIRVLRSRAAWTAWQD